MNTTSKIVRNFFLRKIFTKNSVISINLKQILLRKYFDHRENIVNKFIAGITALLFKVRYIMYYYYYFVGGYFI